MAQLPPLGQAQHVLRLIGLFGSQNIFLKILEMDFGHSNFCTLVLGFCLLMDFLALNHFFKNFVGLHKLSQAHAKAQEIRSKPK